MTRFLASTALMVFVAGVAQGNPYNIPPDQVVKPCEKHYNLSAITRIVVPMTPFRGVNLIFPYQLHDNKTLISLSSNLTWKVFPAKGGSIIPINFINFANNWGEMNDLTISTGDHVVSVGLVADPNVMNHCTNVVLDLSPEELERIKNGRREAYKQELDADYQERLSNLDHEIDNKALALVGALAQDELEIKKIHEANSLTLRNGDEIELYVENIQYYGRFSVVKAEMENDAEKTPVYIKSVKVIMDDDEALVIEGHAEFTDKVKPGSAQEIIFVSLKEIPTSKVRMVAETDKGTVEVKW